MSPGPLPSKSLSELPEDAATDAMPVVDREATRQARELQVGQRPGTLNIREGALKPRLFLASYNENVLTEEEFSSRKARLLA